MKGTPVKKPNLSKKDLIRFLAAGAAGLIIHKLEGMINKKADDYFGPDEPKQDN